MWDQRYGLEAYTPQQVGRMTGGPPDARLCVSASDVGTELAGLGFEILGEREREVLDGRSHTGLSHVVQMLARKPEWREVAGAGS